MKVTVTKFLNVRVGEPRVNAPNYQYLAPGSILEIDGNVYEGDTYEGNNKWYKDEAGNYYWSGGIDHDQNIAPEIDKTNPFSSYEGNGQSIGIAIFDSGVNNQHVYLKNRIKYYENFIAGSDLTKVHIHGHKVAGVIASDDPNANRNKSDLYCFRISSEYNLVDDDALLKGMNVLNQTDTLFKSIDIVNMSLNIGDSSYYLPKIQVLVNSLLEKGIVTVISAGNNFESLEIAELNNVIKVGAFTQDSLSKILENEFINPYDFSFLNSSISCYPMNGINLTAKFKDVSAYTAFMSAILTR
ncbi:MAG: S8/S53 family peptidase, partial [Flavobacteriales bacterium]|nr:S8/S53 family peptidase [Flavobacteriales bacterium]